MADVKGGFERMLVVSITGEHYAVWDRELFAKEILDDLPDLWSDRDDLTTCFVWDETKICIRAGNGAEVLLFENGVIKIDGVATEVITSLNDIKCKEEPWIRLVQKHPEEASADCLAEGEFDPSLFRILTDEIILADMPTKVIVGLRYGEKELDIDVSGKDSDDDELFVNVWYKGQCYSPSETERLPADFVAKWKADNPSYDWENPNVSMDEEMFNEVLRRMKYRLQDCDVLCRENCNRIECTINCSLGRVLVTGHLHTDSAGIIQGVEELEVHDLNEVANGNISELQTEIGTSSEVLKELLMRFG